MVRKDTITKGGYNQPILGRGEMVTNAWGTQKVSNDYSLFHGMFTFDIPDRAWILTENGVELPLVSAGANGSTSTKGKLRVISGLNSTSLTSKRHPRYQPNRGHLYSSSIFLPSKDASGTRDFGMFTEDNGVFFRLVDGIFRAIVRSDGIEVYDQEITIPFSVDLNKGNIFDIQMQWRGVGNITWLIGNPATGVSEVVHVAKVLGDRDELTIANPALPVAFLATNGGDSVEIGCGCVDLTSEGGNKEAEQFISVAGNEVTVDANIGTTASDNLLLAIRIPRTFNGEINTRDSRLLKLKIASDKRGEIYVQYTRDETAISVITGTWEPIGAGNIEVFKPVNAGDALVDLTKTEVLDRDFAQAGQTTILDNPAPSTVEAFLTLGDYLFILGTGNTASMGALAQLGEEI